MKKLTKKVDEMAWGIEYKGKLVKEMGALLISRQRYGKDSLEDNERLVRVRIMEVKP